VLFDKMYVAERRGMTLWPCTCADDMQPLERRLWCVFYSKVRSVRTQLDEQISVVRAQMAGVRASAEMRA